MAATGLKTSNTYLGAQFRRMRTKLGPVAIKATTAKLARQETKWSSVGHCSYPILLR